MQLATDANRMILCGMLDLCRIIFGIVVDLFRPRAVLEAEILVLRQQIIVLRRGRPSRVPFLVALKKRAASDRRVLSDQRPCVSCASPPPSIF